MINLMNEWGSYNIMLNVYVLVYNSVILMVCQVYSGWIIIDIFGYGQEMCIVVDVVKGINGMKINDINIVLLMYIYFGVYNQG